MTIDRAVRRNYTAVRQKRKGLAGRAAAAAWSGTKRGLEVALKTGKEAILAANPISDAYRLYQSGKNLVRKPDWAKYKKELKQGKFLGEGNLANVMFTTGMVTTGMYLPLLGIRAGIGGLSYLGKRGITSDYALPKVSKLVGNRKWIKGGIEKVLGIRNGALEKKLSERNVKRVLKKWKDDKHYRQQVHPYIMEGAIGLRGYGTLIGAKWLAGLAEKGAKGIERNSSNGVYKKFARKIGSGAGIARNAIGDYIALRMFSKGVQKTAYDIRRRNGEEKNEGKGLEDKALEEIQDAGKKVWSGVKEVADEAKELAIDAAEGAWNAGKWVATGQCAKDAKDMCSYFKEGKYRNDALEAVIKDIPQGLCSLGKAVYNDISSTLLVNPSEKYAVLITGYDRFSENDFITAEQVRVYNELLEMGFPKENIIVMSPEGIDSVDRSAENYPKGAQALYDAYKSPGNHIATEEGVKETLEKMAEKVDGNDVFVMHLTAHGESDWKGRSCVGLRNGSQTMYDHELRDYAKGIQGGQEVYFVGACHSGGFAKELGKEGDIAIAASREDQVSISDDYGRAMSAYFFDEMNKRGGLNNTTSLSAVKDCLVKAGQRFRNEYGNGIFGSYNVRNQDPQICCNGIQEGTNKRAA